MICSSLKRLLRIRSSSRRVSHCRWTGLWGAGQELLRRFEAVDGLSEHEKDLAKEILDLVILKHRFRQMAETGAP